MKDLEHQKIEKFEFSKKKESCMLIKKHDVDENDCFKPISKDDVE